MPERCVVTGCSNTRNLDEGISLHTIPFYGDERPEAKKRRKNWVSFVKQKRAKWEPTRHSVICSKHFKDTDFSQRFSEVEGLRMQGKRCLNSDELGVSVFPSVIHWSYRKSPDRQSQTTGKLRNIYLWGSSFAFFCVRQNKLIVFLVD